MFLPHQLHAMPAVNQLVETEFGTQDHMRSKDRDRDRETLPHLKNAGSILPRICFAAPLLRQTASLSPRLKIKAEDMAKTKTKIAFSHFPQQKHAVALIGNIIDNTEHEYRQLIEYKVLPPCMDANKYGLHLWLLFGSDG